MSAIVVLAAFAIGIRFLAGEAFGRRDRMPRMKGRAPGRRSGLLLWPFRILARILAWILVLAARFAVGAPLGQRRTDATFRRPGTQAVAGRPRWFGRGEPGRSAYLPGWQRAALRWTVLVIAAGLALGPFAQAWRSAGLP